MGRLLSQRQVITLLFIQILHIIISFLRSQLLHSWHLTSIFFNERIRKDRTRWKAWQKTTSVFFFLAARFLLTQNTIIETQPTLHSLFFFKHRFSFQAQILLVKIQIFLRIHGFCHNFFPLQMVFPLHPQIVLFPSTLFFFFLQSEYRLHD